MNRHESNTPNESEALREDWVIVGRVDANGNRYDDVEQRREVSILANGAVVQKVWSQEREYGCLHDARRPRGGRCGEKLCDRDSCVDCFKQCSSCQVGLCLMHVRYLENESGQKVPVCSHCCDTIQRRRLWRKFWAFVLSPFVSFDDHSK